MTTKLTKRQRRIVADLERVVALMRAGDRGIWRRVVRGDGPSTMFVPLEDLLANAFYGGEPIDNCTAGAQLDAKTWAALVAAAAGAGISEEEALGRVVRLTKKRFREAPVEFPASLRPRLSTLWRKQRTERTLEHPPALIGDPPLFSIEPAIDDEDGYCHVLDEIATAAGPWPDKGARPGFEESLTVLILDTEFLREALAADLKR